MNCKDICELLTAYLDGEVTVEEKAYIETHLPNCPQCRAELGAFSAMRENLRGALTAMADEVTPSPQLWEKIRDRLETKESRKGFWSSFTLGRVATAATAVVVLVIAVVIWQYGGILEMGSPPPTPAPAPEPTPEPEPAPTPTPEPAPSITLPRIEFERIAPSIHELGEGIEINLSFINGTPDPAIMNPFPPEVNIVRLNERQPEGTVRTFPAGTGERLINPGETVPYKITWDQYDDNGHQVAPGWYDIELTVTSRTSMEEHGGSIGGLATRVLILPPQGVMERTIAVNQSQTVTDLPFVWGREEQRITLTITLESVEMTSEGVIFNAFITSPSYTLPQGPQMAPPQWMLAGYARYTVDGVVKEAGVASMHILEDGLQLRWGYEPEKLDPIPSDAKELTFTITKLSDWEGPWEFRIPLE